MEKLKFIMYTNKMKKIKVLLSAFLLIGCILPINIFATEPTNTPANGDSLSLHAQSAIIMDAKSGTILYEKNGDAQHYPASITKILTLYLALQKLDDNATLTTTHEAIDAVPRSSSHVALDYDEIISVKDLEYAMMLSSANDAANVLATGISGDLSSFAQLMNETAKELGCTNSNFVNANGLHDDNHKTSAKDIALIMQTLIKDQRARDIMATVSYSMSPTNKQSEQRTFSTAFNMIKNTEFADERVEGGKNGYTPEAGYTSVAYALYNNLEIIMVVMAEPDADSRYSDFNKMMEFAFANYKTVVLDAARIGEKAITIVENEQEHDVTFYMDSAINILLPFSTDESLISSVIEVEDTSSVESAKARVDILLGGQKIGSANLKVRDFVAVEEPVEQDEQEETIKDRFMALTGLDIASLIVLGLFVLLIVFKSLSRITSI